MQAEIYSLVHQKQMNSPLSKRCRARFEEAKAEGKKLTMDEVEHIIASEEAKGKRERQRAGIHPRAQEIYDVYPRHEGGTASLAAISKAIENDGFEPVFARTKEYGAAVARWPWNRRRSASGSNLIPLPATWFGNRRYFDDTAEWYRGTGTTSQHSAPAPAAPQPTVSDEELARRSAEERARWVGKPEPEYGSLEHALWEEANKMQRIADSIGGIMSAPVEQVENEQRLRDA